MTGKMTPSAFDKVIEQDIEWLEEVVSEDIKNNSLEFSHIIDVLRYASEQYADNGKRIGEIQKDVDWCIDCAAPKGGVLNSGCPSCDNGK